MPDVTDPSRLERVALGILAALLILVPLTHSGSLSDHFDFPKVLVCLGAAFLLTGLAVVSYLFGEEAPGISSPVLWPAAIFVAAAALAVVPSANRGLALWGLLRLAIGPVIFWAVTRFVRNTRGAAILLGALLVSASIVSLGTLAQVFVPDFSLALGGLSILPASAGGSTLGDAGMSAQFLLLALPAGVGAAVVSRGRWRVACGGLLGLVASALIYIGRPDIWIVGGLLVALLACTRILQVGLGRRPWTEIAPDLGGEGLRAFLAAVLMIVFVVSLSRWAPLLPAGRAVTPLGGVSLLSPTTGDPSIDRAAAVRGSLSLIARHPFGVGPDNWRHAFLGVAWTTAPKSPFTLSHQAVHAGNSFVEATVETGLLGGMALALLLAILVLQAGFASVRAPSPWGGAAHAALNLFAAIVLTGCLGSPLQQPAAALLFWVLAGVTQVALTQAGEAAAIVPFLMPRAAPFLPRSLRRRSLGYLAAAAWVAAAVLLVPRLTDRVAALRLTQAGQSAFYSGQYEAALLALEQPAARRSPDHLPRALAASAYLRLGFPERAAQEFSETLARSPHFVSAYLGRAVARQGLGLYDLADQDLQDALRLWPDNPDTHLALGRLNTARGLFDAAISEYQKALRIDPSSAEAYFQMGGIYMRRGQIDEAIESYRACLVKNPRYPRLNIYLGNAFSRKGLPDMALRSYQMAAGLDEKDVEARLLIANASHALGQACQAKEALEAARDLETDLQKREGILGLIRKVEPDCAREIKTQALQR
ncbi:MAG TPA: tetratricopeptide repeat protein [Candidatus Polarisedimenticolia bacterium]|nr:tetratricopeptide repeat protein [Candidatus Polarisedimenticolia bacterium]